MSSSSGPQSPADPLAGTPYRTLGPLGSGGMGEVVEAEHIALAKRVVVKILHRRLTDRPDLVARLQFEGRALAHLAHPNIVAVSDLQLTPDGRPYLVMERLYGRTLRAELSARRSLPVAEAVAIVRQALAALAAAHNAGILHRDVKLENIFLCDPKDSTEPRVVKLLDFGLAKIMQDRRRVGPAPPEHTTEEGVALGTPRLFAPEQVAYGRLDERTDIYAMGLVLYSLVAGRGPFEHLTKLHEVLEAHVWILPERPSHFAPQPIPPAVDEVILKALAKRPEHRFPSAHAFAEALWLALLPRPRWVSTEPLDQNAVASALAMRPPPPPAPRWTDTDPLPMLRWPTSGGTPSPPDTSEKR